MRLRLPSLAERPDKGCGGLVFAADSLGGLSD